MSDDRKTKKQLLAELEHERERSDALYQVSNKLAGAHDTDEVLELIVNEAARLIRLLAKVARANTEAAAAYATGLIPVLKMEEGTSVNGHVMATKKPLFGEAGRQMLPWKPLGS